MAVYFPRALAVISVLFDGDDTRRTFEAVPRSVEWLRNTTRQADTFRLELDYRDFPLDPRTLRSVLVLLYCADVQAPTARIDPARRDQLVFAGYADEPETVLSDSGEVVTLSGRDYTGLLLDYRWGSEAVDVERPLRSVVESILETVPGASTLPVEFGAGSAGTDLSTLTGKTIWSPQSDDDAWTVLSELCAIAGLVPVVELDTLRILAAEELGAAAVTLLYGWNISRLRFTRRFNEARSGQVELHCWDPQKRTARSAVFPAEPVVVRRRISPSGQVSSQAAPTLRFNVEGAYTVPELEAIAERIYTSAAREQIEGELETRELEDLNGVSLPQLSNGDALEVVLGTQLQADIAHLSAAEAEQRLTSGPHPMDPLVARAFVAGWQLAQNRSSRFYVKQAQHAWDREQGYRVVITFINFVPGA